MEFVDKKGEEKEQEEAKTGAAAARAMFQNKTRVGQAEKKVSASSWQKHISPITSMSAMAPAGSAACSQFSTTGKFRTKEHPEPTLTLVTCARLGRTHYSLGSRHCSH